MNEYHNYTNFFSYVNYFTFYFTHQISKHLMNEIDSFLRSEIKFSLVNNSQLLIYIFTRSHLRHFLSSVKCHNRKLPQLVLCLFKQWLHIYYFSSSKNRKKECKICAVIVISLQWNINCHIQLEFKEISEEMNRRTENKTK